MRLRSYRKLWGENIYLDMTCVPPYLAIYELRLAGKRENDRGKEWGGRKWTLQKWQLFPAIAGNSSIRTRFSWAPLRLPFYSFNHSQLLRERPSKKEGGCGGEMEVSKPICSIPKLLLTSLFSSIPFMMEFQNIESLHVHSFILFSFCVYCRVQLWQ